jgi:hypothetical protein
MIEAFRSFRVSASFAQKNVLEYPVLRFDVEFLNVERQNDEKITENVEFILTPQTPYGG